MYLHGYHKALFVIGVSATVLCLASISVLTILSVRSGFRKRYALYFYQFPLLALYLSYLFAWPVAFAPDWSFRLYSSLLLTSVFLTLFPILLESDGVAALFRSRPRDPECPRRKKNKLRRFWLGFAVVALLILAHNVFLTVAFPVKARIDSIGEGEAKQNHGATDGPNSR